MGRMLKNATYFVKTIVLVLKKTILPLKTIVQSPYAAICRMKRETEEKKLEKRNDKLRYDLKCKRIAIEEEKKETELLKRRLGDLRNECEQLEKENELIMMKQQEDKGQEYGDDEETDKETDEEDYDEEEKGIRNDVGLSDQELMMKTTRELNKLLKKKCIDKDRQKEIKQERRMLKNGGYAAILRMKRETEEKRLEKRDDKLRYDMKCKMSDIEEARKETELLKCM